MDIIKKMWVLLPAAVLTMLLLTSSAHAVDISISSSVPGMSPITTNTVPGDYVAGFYQFALMIGGVLAFGAIVWGGILYASSAGNPGKQSEGREWIKSALLGLLLLAGAYLVLNTINPNLVNLNLPKLSTINTAPAGH